MAKAARRTELVARREKGREELIEEAAHYFLASMSSSGKVSLEDAAEAFGRAVPRRSPEGPNFVLKSDIIETKARVYAKARDLFAENDDGALPEGLWRKVVSVFAQKLDIGFDRILKALETLD